MQHIVYRGIRLTVGKRTELQQALLESLETPRPQQVVTVNPEYVVLAHRQPNLATLTQGAAHAFVDGIGLAWALRRHVRTDRYTGADAVQDLCTAAARRALHVGVLIPPRSLSRPDDIRSTLEQRYPGVRCTVWIDAPEIAHTIARVKPRVLFVTTGQPHQDLWIAEHLNVLVGTSVFIGVGGALDFLTGTRRRAPRIFQHSGLEWLWRFMTQPWRLPRIFRATFGFWFTILFR